MVLRLKFSYCIFKLHKKYSLDRKVKNDGVCLRNRNGYYGADLKSERLNVAV